MGSQQAPAGEAVRTGAGTSMADAAELFKAVAHPVRAKVLELLCRGESSIPELCEGTGVKASHLSRHLTQMRAQHLVRCLRSGGRLVYRLAYPEAADLLAAARSVLIARTATSLSQLTPADISARPDAAPPAGSSPMAKAAPDPTIQDEQFRTVEASLASRWVIARACETIAARSGCDLETAARRLLTAASSRNITLLQAAEDQLHRKEEPHREEEPRNRQQKHPG